MRTAAHLLGAMLTMAMLSCTSVRVPGPTQSTTPEPTASQSDIPEAGTVTGAATTDRTPSEASTLFTEAMFTRPEVDPALERRVRSIIDVAPYHQTHWGIVARDMHSGQILYELNSHQTFVPGSAMKVLVTAGALAELGPDYRYSTALWATGPIRQGTIQGALLLDGRGDPTLSGRFRTSGQAALAELADLVVRSGVRRVNGPLIIDASRWDSTSVPGSWMGEDLGWAWAASGGAFVVSEGELTATVYGGSAVGDPARVEWNPDLGPERLAADVTTWALDSTALQPGYRSEARQIVLGGTIGVNTRKRESVAARDPVRIAGELLLRELRDRGVRIDGGLEFRWTPAEAVGSCSSGTIDACPTATRVARLESPPLMEIVRALLKPSQNWMTEQLLRTLGAERGERGSWAEGLRILQGVLNQEYAVLSSDLDIYDGSGLSAYNLVTPRAMSDILFRARILAFGDEFRAALAEPGERGTLAGRLSELEGRVFAKTGTLKHTNSLSGYLVRDNGREMVFSILTNNSGLESREVRDVIDRLVVELSGW